MSFLQNFNFTFPFTQSNLGVVAPGTTAYSQQPSLFGTSSHNRFSTVGNLNNISPNHIQQNIQQYQNIPIPQSIQPNTQQQQSNVDFYGNPVPVSQYQNQRHVPLASSIPQTSSSSGQIFQNQITPSSSSSAYNDDYVDSNNYISQDDYYQPQIQQQQQSQLPQAQQQQRPRRRKQKKVSQRNIIHHAQQDIRVTPIEGAQITFFVMIVHTIELHL